MHPPEKDLGFPYRSLFGPGVDQAMLRFSWHAYLVETKKLVDWIDDQRSAPTHIQWTEYLRWAATRCGLQPTIGRVERVQSHATRWQVGYLSSKSHRMLTAQADGIVVTGPGEPYKL